jgi:SAM-dependent methyltransferase
MIWLLATILLVLSVWLVYPGELSWLPGNGTRWLYDRAAPGYHRKWARHDYEPYDNLIHRAAREVVGYCDLPRVVDLACGSGRAIRCAAARLGPSASYHAVDFSQGMLERCQEEVRHDPAMAGCNIHFHHSDALAWLRARTEPFDMLLLMEAAEFIAHAGALLDALGRAAAPGARLVMTRPAGCWSALFPGRRQGRRQLTLALQEAGFEQLQCLPWRARYELVYAVKGKGGSSGG